jgi:MFS transporter, DHA2 family, multidrug resistance protein
VPLRLFRMPAFTASLAANTLSLFLIFGSFFLTAHYLQLALGLQPLAAGAWSMLPATGFIAGSQLAPVLMRRAGAGITMASGLVIAAGGLAGLAMLPGSGGSALAVQVGGSVLLALGISPVVTLATDMIIRAVPAEQAGVASGLSETGTELGGALGIALLGSIATAVYRGQLTGTRPAGIRPPAITTARGSLAAAVHTAGQFPSHLGTLLRTAARDAFTQGLHTAAILGAAIAIALALAAGAVLRRVGQAPYRDRGTSPAENDQLRAAPTVQAKPCGDS